MDKITPATDLVESIFDPIRKQGLEPKVLQLNGHVFGLLQKELNIKIIYKGVDILVC